MGMPSLRRPALSSVLNVPWTMPWGADVHPAAGGHLAVVGDAERGGAVEVLLIVEGADHQAVGDDDAGRHLVGVEQAQRMAGHDDQRLLVGQLLDKFFLMRRYCIQFWQT